MLTMRVKESEFVQIAKGDEQILIKTKKDGNSVRLTIIADKSWRVRRGTLEEAKK